MEKIQKALRYYMFFIAILALFTLVISPGLVNPDGSGVLLFGFDFHRIEGIVDVFIIVSFLLSSFLRLLFSKKKVRHIRENPVEYVLVFMFLAQLLVIRLLFTEPSFVIIFRWLNIESWTKLYIILMQGYMVILTLGEFSRANSGLFNMPVSPSSVIVLSFLLVILFGTMLLTLPGATVSGRFSFLEALFTATSATCVTGLIIVPTGSVFTRYGHNVILFLIQIGGLGLMTFASFFGFVLRGDFGMRQRMLLGDILDNDVLGTIKGILLKIVSITFAVELIGAVLIFLSVYGNPVVEDPLYFSIFHSVSAFCNAGFSTMDSNLELFHSNIDLSVIFAVLIILGGLGFMVHINIFRFIRNIHKEIFIRKPHFSLQTKIVVVVSVVLIFLGALVIFSLMVVGMSLEVV